MLLQIVLTPWTLEMCLRGVSVCPQGSGNASGLQPGWPTPPSFPRTVTDSALVVLLLWGPFGPQ